MRNIERFLILTSFSTICAQNVAPRGLPLRPAAQAYEVSAQASRIQIGATYMGRSFSARVKGSPDDDKTALYDSGNFIVVEVGAFAEKTFQGELLASDFHLRISDKKVTLLPVAPGLVASALRNRDMDPQRRRLVYGGGVNDGGVTVGEPRPQARFPGDPRPGKTQPVGTVNQNNGERDWDAAIESSLVEGGLQSARAGNLYFEFTGKMTKVKSLILEYDGAGGQLELKLR